jgi:hypothetical protein
MSQCQPSQQLWLLLNNPKNKQNVQRRICSQEDILAYEDDDGQKTEALKGFYDKLWKTYITKEKISKVGKDAFVEVAKIAMSAQADGANLSWKWVGQYAQLPYGEFMAFYADLSRYIEDQRNGYFALETERQSIVNEHNTMLKLFPNNLYNVLAGRKQLVFKYGFLSDSTNKVFATGVENLDTK